MFPCDGIGFIQAPRGILLVMSGPCVAFLYSIIVWICYAVTKECRWTDKLDVIGLRLAWVVCSLAWSIEYYKQQQTQPSQIENTQYNYKTCTDSTLWVTIGTLLVWLISLYLCYMTRIRDVVGFTRKPFYGKNHLQGKVIVITGANQGIGKETTYQLACMGAEKIFMLCRSPQRGTAARNEILKIGSGLVQPDQLQVITMDLGSYKSVRNAVDIVRGQLQSSQNKNISVLINNAGVMMGTQTTSIDGHDLMMQANHLGHFLLTNLLIQQGLVDVDNARILTITSSTHEFCKAIDFDDLFCGKSRTYTLFGQYSMSKLANILFAKELARRTFQQKNVHFRSYAIHPGIVRTNVTSNMQWYWRYPNILFGFIVASLQKNPPEGAYSQVYMASAPPDQLPKNGSYISNGKAYPSSKASESSKDAIRLWEFSEVLVGIDGKAEHNEEKKDQ